VQKYLNCFWDNVLSQIGCPHHRQIIVFPCKQNAESA
jgi:hypothetical protein